ncbi:MAG: exodeoxyribonuclease III [Gammaproteobacteria bacterium]|nr:exodeoxyribonuclease III [Gammaproteobacteria bacterium]
MKIATWNINSLRVRLPHVISWLQQVRPDILALQETKITNDCFPFDELKVLGYEVIASGQRTYNGVAILSRLPISQCVVDLPDITDPQRRVLCATIGDLRILNLYIPNGEGITSPKYEYKLKWLRSLDTFLKTELADHPKMVVLGDFNIAPEEIDVYNPKRWQGKVLFSPPERESFRRLLDAGFADCFRTLYPEERKFSWWDYRLQAFPRGWGLRIDHILASNSLIKQCIKCEIDQAPRAWERPSDHAPVLAEFRL